MTTAPERTGEPARRNRLALVVAASAVGTVFEWYDFFIFGSLAAIIGRQFFSGVGAAQSYLLALLTFAAGFAVRPFGAIIFGWFGDRTGRKRTFLVTITLMGLATFLVAVLPGHAAIGGSAGYLLVALRMLQGFAIGGEYGGAAIYVAEHTTAHRRGLATSWVQGSAGIGLALALVVILTVRTAVGETAFAAWGWRVPFAVSLLLLALSLWIRLKLAESPEFRRIQAAGALSRAPLAEAFLRWRNLRWVLTVLFGILAGQGVVWYTAQFYSQFFLERVIAVPPVTVNLLLLVATLASAPLYLFFGWLSDRIGRKPVMLFGLGLAALGFIPGFHLLAEAANPALASANARAPVVVVAPPADCSLQFDLIGRAKFVTACDVAKAALTDRGIAYSNRAAPPGTAAVILVGHEAIASVGAAGLGMPAPAIAMRNFAARLRGALAAAGYPLTAAPDRIDLPLTLAVLLFFLVAATALYGPQAAALVELFPTRIRYTALSVPYHIGVGWFGGFLPATAFAIVAATGNLYAGLWYPVAVAGIGFFVTLFFLPETLHRQAAQ
ncbi:MAG TPA: MFS transporter [Steroidobacteraceae bacterium]|nr:MFS transporter [Steroidobacteraceae bacterium]